MKSLIVKHSDRFLLCIKRLSISKLNVHTMSLIVTRVGLLLTNDNPVNIVRPPVRARFIDTVTGDLGGHLKVIPTFLWSV